MPHPRSITFRATVAALSTPVLLLALTACGGSGGANATSSATGTPAAGPNAQGAEGAGRGFGGADFTAIQACLKAAGVSLPTPSGMPGGGPRPSGVPRPSGTFDGTPPADGVRPSGAPGGPGGGGGMFQDATVRAALKACGIAVPTGGARRPTATPTASS